MNETGQCESRALNESTQDIYREFVIEIVDNGIIARVGCKRFVFDNFDECVKAIKDYIKSPQEVRDAICMRPAELLQ